MAPPFTSLCSADEILKNTNIGLSAQNMWYENSGAYTGEIAPNMIKTLGCKYVIIGHSERREYFGETNEKIDYW